MKIFLDCSLWSFEPKSFMDKKTGEVITFNHAVFLNQTDSGEREVLELNTKIELKDSVDKNGVLELEIDPKGQQKPRLLSFVPKSSR